MVKLYNVYEFSTKKTIEVELPLKINFNISKGYPQNPPSYSCGGEPGMLDEVEDIEIVIDQKKLKKKLKNLLLDMNTFPEDYEINRMDLLSEVIE